MTRSIWARLKPFFEFLASFFGAMYFIRELLVSFSSSGSNPINLTFSLIIIGSIFFIGYSVGKTQGIYKLLFHVAIALVIINISFLIFFLVESLGNRVFQGIRDIIYFSVGFIVRFLFFASAVAFLRDKTRNIH